jgi:hypothetical protein
MAPRSPVITIVPATGAHARELAPRMRASDAAEVLASGGYTPYEALNDALLQSDMAYTALFDGQVACMWGVTPVRRSALVGRIGAAWLLTSDLVERYPRAFWRGCKVELERLFESYDLLVNAIDCRHEQAIRWSKRLGFRLEEPQSYGEDGLLFRWFRVRKEDLHV